MSLKNTLAKLLAPAAAVAEKTVFTTALNLPPGLQRRLAGPPIVVQGQTLAVDTQLMLRLQRLSGQPELAAMSIARIRSGMDHQAVVGGGRHPIGTVRDLDVAGIPARLYTPSTLTKTPGPLLVFLHGGGFVFGGLESHDGPCRLVAELSGVRILAVDYRLAPEHPFPAAYDDAVAAFDWAVSHAAYLGADPERIGVGGDSAGGNLAAGVALAALEKCAFQLLIYPVTDVDAETESRRLFAQGFFLTSEFVDFAGRSYVGADVDHRDPRISPLYASIPPEGVAPAYVATAGFDPLRDEGEAYARRLEEAGVKVETRRYADQIHAFFNVVGAGHTAKAAVAEIAAVLRDRL